MTKQRRGIVRKLFWLNVPLTAVSVVYYLIYRYADGPLFGIKVCFVRELLGIYCPGCGGSRSLVRFLSGDFLGACHYYPALPYTALVLFLYDLSLGVDFVRGRDALSPRFPRLLFYAIPVIVFLTFVLRAVLWLGFGIDALGDLS